MPSPELAILILNYNGYQDTIPCLESILEDWHDTYELVVIDNASTDDSVERIRSWAQNRIPRVDLLFGNNPDAHREEPGNLPRLTLLQAGENRGFSAGNNVGIRYALEREARWVLLLNNDTIVTPQAFERMIEGAERSSADLAGCSVYEYTDPTRPWYLGGRFSWWGDRPLTSAPEHSQGSGVFETDWITGCCLLVRQDVFRKIGLLDERAFLYLEDSDFCRRAARVRFKRVVVSEAKVHHKISQSVVEDSPFQRYHGTRSRVYFHRKHHSTFSHFFFLLAFVSSRLVRSLVWLVQGRSDLIAATWPAVRDSSKATTKSQSVLSPSGLAGGWEPCERAAPRAVLRDGSNEGIERE